jgi:hypothetical protein
MWVEQVFEVLDFGILDLVIVIWNLGFTLRGTMIFVILSYT